MKRILWILPLILLVITAMPAAAQQIAGSLLDWIPADFTAYVRVDMSNPQVTLSDLNLTLLVAAVLQPSRAQFTQSQSFDHFFPLTSFDMENASFATNVLPWLQNEVIFAYRSLGANFSAATADTLMILPTDNAFVSANAMNPVITAQDFPHRETYRNLIIYQGDQTAFAFTPSALLVGPDDLLHEAIDTLTGNADALTADPTYQQVTAALPDGGVMRAYLAKDAAAHALSVLVSGGDSADPVLSAISEAIASADSDKTPERLLMSGAVDGIGISIDYNRLRATDMQARVVLHTSETPDSPDTPFDASVLDLIPRSAMIVQSGTNAAKVATDALYMLPFLNFAGTTLGAFPIQPSAATGVLNLPNAQDVETAVNNFLDAVKPVVDVRGEVLNKLDGSYSLAVLPRPNDPIPGLNVPVDLLLVVKTDSAATAQAVQASASTLLALFTSPLESEQIGTQTFQTLRAADTNEPLVRIGAVDDLLVIGTGSAAQLALDAQRGDNRLTKQDRWVALSQNGQIPFIYVDVNAFYNTFLPQLGGASPLPISQLGVQSRYLGSNLFGLDLQVTLAQ